MAVKIYLDPTGTTVIIDNGTAQSNVINVEEFFFDKNDETQEVTIRDSNDDYKLRTQSSEVQDKGGIPIGTYQDVVDFLTSIVATGSSVGGATEATLISVLNAIVASDQDIEILLVRDTGDNDVVLQQITNYETGVPVVTYKDVNGVLVTPVGPLQYLDPSAVMNLMLTELQNQSTILTSIDSDTSNALIELLAQGITLDSLETLITALNATVSTEVTLALVLAELQAINIDVNGLSLEATQQSVLTALNTVITNTTGLSTEATLALVNSNIVLGNGILGTLLTEATFSAEDFATEATLAGIKTQTDLLNFISTALEVTVSSSALPTGAATEVTLAALEAKLNTLGRKAETASAPVVLSTEDLAALVAIETAINSLTVTIPGVSTEVTLAALLLAFNTEDFATETTLASLAATDFATQTTLQALLTAFSAEDFASEVTLQALLTAINGEDFATETTLAAVLVALGGLATEATLGAVLVDTTSIDNRLTPVARIHNTLVARAGTAIGTVPAGSLRGSVLNSGNNPATWNGISIPAGVSIPWDAVGNKDTYGAIAYDALLSTLIIEYTT